MRNYLFSLAVLFGFVCFSSAKIPLSPITSDSVQNISESEKPVIGLNPLDGVPHYDWHYGCSPTSGAMLVGYWDSKPGYGNLFYGDASTDSSATQEMTASDAHKTAGFENGYTYGDWHNSTSYPDHESNPDCVADFMRTVNGGTYLSQIATGLENYIGWDNPATPINESYQAAASIVDDPYWTGGTFTYQGLKNEIDNDRPLILDFTTCHPSENDWLGHSTVCYGYQDDMFSVYSIALGCNIVVPGIAIDDTWANGSYASEWLYDQDGDGNADSVFSSQIDTNGVEWWPFLTLSDTGGSSYTSYYDWAFSEAITLDITIPEPATLLLFATGVVFVRNVRKI